MRCQKYQLSNKAVEPKLRQSAFKMQRVLQERKDKEQDWALQSYVSMLDNNNSFAP